MSESERDAGQELLDYLQLSGPERYAAFLAEVSAGGRLWVAESGEYVLTLFDDQRNELLPVWPSADTARAALAQAPHLKGYAPVVRELAAWRERAAPALSEAGVSVGVFPDAAMQCAVVAPSELLAHLDALLADDGDGEDETSRELDLEQARRALAQKFAKPDTR
ncbi:DUF2750 domain-containing protein [Lysobacter sp. CA199]|uniref:DUF2750 domain-containing protein n=1 Tax=Lysobacter sp. CA199 TaxID=3455608 RepID=UPI003F8D533D